MLKKCVACGQNKPLTAFGKTGGKYRRNKCRPCVGRGRAWTNDEFKAYRQAAPVVHVLKDCKSSDRKNGRLGNDLDREYVTEALTQPCTYCQTTEVKMTLDRIDNGLAHTKANVVPACLRCNYLKGSMPHVAWLNLVPAVRSTAEAGLFGDWRTSPISSKK